MVINNVFQGGVGMGTEEEQDMVEQNTIEIIQMAGQDFYYLPRTLVKLDPVLHEDPLSQFTKYYTIEMYIMNTNEYGGQGYNVTEMGISAKDNIELIVAKKRMAEAAASNTPEVPLSGDLLYWPLTNSLWQIGYVDPNPSPFYTLSNLHVIRLECVRYVYSYEDFATGIFAVDNAFNNFKTPFNHGGDINNEGKNYLDTADGNPFGAITEDHEDNQ